MDTYTLVRRASLLAILPLATACAPLADVHEGTGAGVIPVRAYNEPYQIAPLDEIIISKGSQPPVNIKITTDSPVEYPDGQPLKVIGRNADEVAAILRRRDDSITSVAIDEYRGNCITVTGEVNIQTNFDLQDSPTRVLDAIASAGGFTPLAASSRVRLTRHNAGKVKVFELNLHAAQQGSSDYLNMLLEPGDRIYVPKSFL